METDKHRHITKVGGRGLGLRYELHTTVHTLLSFGLSVRARVQVVLACVPNSSTCDLGESKKQSYKAHVVT